MAREGLCPTPRSQHSSLQSRASQRGLPGPSLGSQGGPHSARHTGRAEAGSALSLSLCPSSLKALDPTLQG